MVMLNGQEIIFMHLKHEEHNFIFLEEMLSTYDTSVIFFVNGKELEHVIRVFHPFIVSPT